MMNTESEISFYFQSLVLEKRRDLQTLHQLILSAKPNADLWFLDGKNEAGKTVSNPNIGYGRLKINYADGSSRDFYQIGISANTTGISIYIMGIDDKKILAEKFGDRLGKGSITGYCIKFKKLKDLDLQVLSEVITFGFQKFSH